MTGRQILLQSCIVAMVYTSTRCLAHYVTHYWHCLSRFVVYNIDTWNVSPPFCCKVHSPWALFCETTVLLSAAIESNNGTLYCTEPPALENLMVAERNMTSIKICWKGFTLVELQGVGNYTIVYHRAGTSRQGATTINVPWTDNCVTIHNLTPGLEYDIAVSISLTSRTSGKYNYYLQ